jgi:hypothetical protein
MRKTVLILLFMCVLTAYSQEDYSPYYSNTAHKIFENYVGDWNVIYANETGSGLPAGGRGISKSTLMLGKTVLKFENYLNYQLGTIVSHYILGYDKFNKDYYFITYDNGGNIPILLHGKYNKENKSFEFKNYKDKPTKDGDLNITIKFERKDKLLITSLQTANGKQRKVLDMALIKK